MIAAAIVFATFVGLALCIGTVAGSILLANGKVTLPGTAMRRLQQEKVAVTVTGLRLERERVQMMLDAQIDLRIQRAALPSAEGVAHGS